MIGKYVSSRVYLTSITLALILVTTVITLPYVQGTLITSLKATSTIESGTANFVTLTNSDNFGFSVAGIGDIDNDGVEDIAAGARFDDTGGADRGAVYVIRLDVTGSTADVKPAPAPRSDPAPEPTPRPR